MEDDNKQKLANAARKLANAIGGLDIDVNTMQNAVDALKDLATVHLGLKLLAQSEEKFQQWVQKIGKGKLPLLCSTLIWVFSCHSTHFYCL